jgi:hypothetical protein
MAAPTPEELAEMFAPVNHDTATAHLYTSWTDADLYRAIQTPENAEDGERREVEIAEYVAELKSRAAKRAAQTVREAELREKYQI